MNDHPLDKHDLLEQIDVCRQGDVDLRDPLLADLAARLASDRQVKSLYERVQRLDVAISQAMEDVPLPPGLEARILAKLAAVEAAASPIAFAPTVVSAVASTPANESGSKATVEGTTASPSRRRWLWAAVATAASVAGVALAVNGWMRGAPPITEAGLAEEAVAFFNAEDLSVNAEVPLLAAEKSHPFSKSVVRPGSTVARRLKAFLGRRGLNGMAYDMSAGGITASLYVVSLPGGLALPSAPPTKPSTTGGCAAGAWQSNGFMYVLVVQGQDREYLNYLNRIPLA